MLKLKLQYFGHLMRRADSLEKTLVLGQIEGRRRRGRQRMRWLDDIIDSIDMDLGRLWALWRRWHLKWGKEVESRTFPLRQEERLPEREIKDCRELGRQLCAWTEQETGKQGHGEAKPGSLNASQTSRRGDVGEGGCAGGTCLLLLTSHMIKSTD